MNSFDAMTAKFTERVARASQWRHAYYGAAYATRIKEAIKELREAITEAETHPEISGNPSSQVSHLVP